MELGKTTLCPANNFEACVVECAACDYRFVSIGGATIRVYSCAVYKTQVSPINGKVGL